MPLRTMQRRIAGSHDVGSILVSAREGVSTEQGAGATSRRLLRERRQIAPGHDDDFNVRDMKEIASTFASSTARADRAARRRRRP